MIHIFYRHYNIVTTDNRSRPKWFDFQKCFKNLLDTIEGKDVQLHVVMDGVSKHNFINQYKDKFIFISPYFLQYSGLNSSIEINFLQ